MAVAERRAKHGIYEPRSALLPGAPGHIHRIVHDRRSRDAIEMEQLVEAESKNRQDVGVDLRQWPIGKVRGEKIEAPLPPQGAGQNLCSEGAVPFIGELRTRLDESRRKVNAVRGNRTKALKCRRARRRDNV